MTSADVEATEALCRLARRCYDAASVSVAVIVDDGLEFIAADGVGGDAVVGTVLPPGRGIAGFVAASGQSLIVNDPSSDPRFARDVGERTGIIPSSIQCVPFVDHHGDTAGVVTLIDRQAGADALDVSDLVTLAGALCAPVDRSGSIDGRLDSLAPRERERATVAIDAILNLGER